MSASPVTTAPLFGGAMSCAIPAEWVNVSEIRQVPDHQEVFFASNHPEQPCLVVEILEYQGEQPNDRVAAYLFDDLAESNGSAVSAFEPHSISMQTETMILCTGVGRQRIAMGPRGTFAPTAHQRTQDIRDVRIEVCVIRLPSVQTDMLLTLSSTILSNTSTTGEMDKSLSESFRRMLSTFKIHEWSLFQG